MRMLLSIEVESHNLDTDGSKLREHLKKLSENHPFIVDDNGDDIAISYMTITYPRQSADGKGIVR